MTFEQIALRAIKENGLYLRYLSYKRGKRNSMSPRGWLDYYYYPLYIALFRVVIPSFMRQFINRRVEIYIMSSNGNLSSKTTSYRIKGYSEYYHTFLISADDSNQGFPCDIGRVASIDGKPFKKWHIDDIIDKWEANKTYELIDSTIPLLI